MNKSLNNVTDRLKQLAEDHHMINDFGLGDTSDIGASKDEARELTYPYLWVDYAETKYAFGNNRGIGYKIYTMSVLVVDKITPNVSNSTEVMSDTEGILSDVIQFISVDKTLRDFRIETADITAEPVSDEDKDGVEGWVARIPFKIPYAFCASELPFVGQTSPPAPSDCVAENSDASYSQSIAPGTTLILPDSVITVNGDSFTLLPATIDLDIDVVDSLDAAVGTVVGTDVIIADSALTNSDGSFNDTVVAEGTKVLSDITITLNGGDTIKTSPSVINVDIEVEDTDGTTGVGSVVGGKIIVPAGGGCLDATSIIKDSLGATLYTNSIVSGATNNQTITDGANTLNGGAVSGIVAQGTKAITLKDTLGATVAPTITTDTKTNLDLVISIPSGVSSNVLMTGQDITYATNDDGARFLAGEYSSVILADISDFYTLVDNNEWGHKKRFTGDTGGYMDESTGIWYDINGVLTTKALALPNSIIRDYMNRRRWYTSRSGSRSWADCLLLVQTESRGGETDWMCPNKSEYESLSSSSSLSPTYIDSRIFNWPSFLMWCSSTIKTDILRSPRYSSGSDTWSSQPKIVSASNAYVKIF